MKKNLLKSILCISTVLIFTHSSHAQGLAVNTDGSTADASAMLDVKSGNKGVLVPRMASTSSVTSPVTGLLVYQTGAPAGFYYYDGASWLLLQNSAAAISANTLSGTTLASGITTSSLTTVGTLGNLTVTNPIAGSTTGNEKPLTFSTPLSRATNTISIQAATTSANGYLSSTDWNTFNNKQATLAAATTSTDGYISSTDWNTFNGKQAAITLTTTGTSGAATLSSGTLNIPQYAAAVASLNYTYTTVSASITATVGTAYLLANSNITITLPSSPSTGAVVKILVPHTYTANKVNMGSKSGFGPISFNVYSSSTSYTFGSDFGYAITLVYNGAEWYLVEGL